MQTLDGQLQYFSFFRDLNIVDHMIRKNDDVFMNVHWFGYYIIVKYHNFDHLIPNMRYRGKYLFVHLSI